MSTSFKTGRDLLTYKPFPPTAHSAHPLGPTPSRVDCNGNWSLQRLVEFRLTSS